MKKKLVFWILAMVSASTLVACNNSKTENTEEIMETSSLITENEKEDLEQNTFLDALVNEWEQIKNDDVEQSEAYKQAYAEYLLGCGYQEGLKFDTAMINEDTIPELLVIDGDSHANSVQIYTYYDGKVLPVIETEYGFNKYGGSGSVKYISRKNVIVSENYAMGGINYIDFYSMDGHHAEKKCHIQCVCGTALTGDTYSIDDIDVTEEEYRSKYTEMVLNNEYELTEKNYQNAMECKESTIKIIFDYCDNDSQNSAAEVSEADVETEAAAETEVEAEADAEAEADVETEVDVEAEVEQIRTWYYDTQNRLDSLQYASYPSDLDCYFDGGYPAKVVAKSGYNDWNVTREYYYHDQKLYFVFVHGDIGEYRFYVKDGQLIRSISPDGSIVDVGSAVSQDVRDISNRVFSEEEDFPLMINCGA